MMNKRKNPIKTGIGLLSALLALTLVVFACSAPTDKEMLTNEGIDQVDTGGDVFTVVEVMPEFPGGMDAMANYLGSNIEYPKEAKDKSVSGKVFVNFIVEKDGTVSNAKTIRGIGSGCDEEAVRVVSAMPNWTPGTQRGQNVRVSFNLPINFKLDDVIDKDSVFIVVEEMPEFPGGNKALMTYLGQNIKYPEEAKKEKISGRVFVSFVVEKDGAVSNVNVLRGIGGGCDEESVRVISGMPNWTPGKDENGEKVRVKYNIPIKYALD